MDIIVVSETLPFRDNVTCLNKCLHTVTTFTCLHTELFLNNTHRVVICWNWIALGVLIPLLYSFSKIISCSVVGLHFDEPGGDIIDLSLWKLGFCDKKREVNGMYK